MPSPTSKLFSPIQLGDLHLSHRVVLAPLTRNRATEADLVPSPNAKTYYQQRATKGGLLISEAVCITSEAITDIGVPGIWNEAQTLAWKEIVDGVHAKGGLMSCQLWHTGRAAHGSFKDHPAATKDRIPTIGASDVAIPLSTRSTLTGEKLPYNAPRPLRVDEVPRLLNDYINAAKNAKKAGFDAIELHAAHGYLLDQFLNNGPNTRTDQYGGSIENRSRLLFQVVEALGTVYPYSRIAVRISPHSAGTMKFYMTDDSDPIPLYSYVVKNLSKYKLAYLFMTEPRWFAKYDSDHTKDPGFSMGLQNPPLYRHLYTGGAVMGAGGFTPIAAGDAIENGEYDVIAFGRWFISNPDLVERLKNGLPLNKYNRKTFYSRTSEGYTDYPNYADVLDKDSLVPQEAVGSSLKQAKL